MSTLSSTLDKIASGASALGRVLPGKAGNVAEVVSALVGFGADIAASNASPIEHIERIRSADPGLRAMRQRWALRAKTPEVR